MEAQLAQIFQRTFLVTIAPSASPASRARSASGAAASSGRLSGMRSTEAFLDDDVVGIAAIGRRRSVSLEAVVGGRNDAGQILLEIDVTGCAGGALVDEAADAGAVADLEGGDVLADCTHDASAISWPGTIGKDELRPIRCAPGGCRNYGRRRNI